jgi:peptidoglycan hydrolase-like protein with peptidoglycan-binding domain
LVISVQRALKAAGYDPGPQDNVLGSQTKSALVKYQKDKGLPIGQLDMQTLKSLGIEQ